MGVGAVFSSVGSSSGSGPSSATITRSPGLSWARNTLPTASGNALAILEQRTVPQVRPQAGARYRLEASVTGMQPAALTGITLAAERDNGPFTVVLTPSGG